jgi:PAS domain S-box-containing protein
MSFGFFKKSFRLYIIAILAVAFSAAARLALHPWLQQNAPFVTFYVAIFLMAWQGGIGPAFFTTVLSLFASHFFFTNLFGLHGSLVSNYGFVADIAHFSVAGILSVFARLMEKSRHRAMRVATIAVSNEVALKQSEARLQLALEASQMAPWEWDIKSNVVSGSQALEMLLGFAPGTFDGSVRSYLKAVDQRDRGMLLNLMQSAVAEKTDFRAEFRVRDQDNITRWIESRGRLTYDEHGHTIKMIGIIANITRRKEAIEQENVLKEATTLLSFSLDYTTAMNSLANLVVEKFCEICVIHWAKGPGLDSERVVAAASHLEGHHKVLVSKISSCLSDQEYLGTHPPLFAVEECVVYENIPIRFKISGHSCENHFAEGEQDSETVLRSVAKIPLASHGQVFGYILLIRLVPPLVFEREDIRFYMELGRRAGLAVENARLFSEAQQAILRHEEELRERIRVEEQLRQSERLYRAIGESIDYGIWICNAEGRVVYVSEGFRKLIGVSLENWSDCQEWGRKLPDDEAQRIFQTWKKCVQTGAKWDQEIVFQTVDGRQLPVLSRGVPVWDENGNIHCWAGIHLDISRQKKAEAELIRAKEEADAASAAKSAFLANTSHEIRTPLGAIVGFSEILASGEPSPQEKLEYAAIIKRNGTLLAGILNDILDLSKIEAGHLSIEWVPTNLLELLNDVKAGLSLSATDKNLALTFECSEDLPVLVETDPTRLKQILTNIIGNAIKFTDQGSVLVRASQIPDGEKTKIIFEIEDTGCGLSEKESQKLFEPFSQADISTTRRFGGTGLGLALSRRLARYLGGDVYLKRSEVSKGSVFRIEISADRTIRERSSGANLALTPSSLVGGGSLKGLSVLVVEDSQDNRLLMTRILQRAGASVVTAENGRDGAQKALQNDYDVILMDVQMPIMDGHAATTHLRQMGYKGPIVALTAHALAADRHRCMVNGFDDYLSKPTTPDQLVQKLAFYAKNEIDMGMH